MSLVTQTLTMTLTGALAANTDQSQDIQLKKGYKITGVQFIEKANASDRSYDVRFSDVSGPVLDYTARLAMVSVVKGATIRNTSFNEAYHPVDVPAQQTVTVNLKNTDALLGGETVVVQIVLRLEKAS